MNMKYVCGPFYPLNGCLLRTTGWWVTTQRKSGNATISVPYTNSRSPGLYMILVSLVSLHAYHVQTGLPYQSMLSTSWWRTYLFVGVIQTTNHHMVDHQHLQSLPLFARLFYLIDKPYRSNLSRSLLFFWPLRASQHTKFHEPDYQNYENTNQTTKTAISLIL